MFKPKKFLLFLLTPFFLIFNSLTFAEEQITITTYYPSPYGSYNQLYVAGSLGIGTTGPNTKLQVYGGSGNLIKLQSSTGMGTAGEAIGITFVQSGDVEVSRIESITESGSNIGLRFFTYATGAGERMRINAAGNVGIGTPSPGSLLDVASPSGRSAFIRATNTDFTIPITFFNSAVTCANGGQWGFGINGTTPATFSTMPVGAFWIHQDCGGPLLTITPGTGNVGIGTASPGGKLDVNGTIYQRGAVLHADYVFEPDYKLESIEEHASYMWQNKHLKAVPRARKDESGQDVLEIGAHRKGMLEELEKAHVYIQQLNERIKVLEMKLSKLAG
ncbi:MAG: hypothetical protein AAB275_03995 [Deltaproteobacteria bacterium]